MTGGTFFRLLASAQPTLGKALRVKFRNCPSFNFRLAAGRNEARGESCKKSPSPAFYEMYRAG